MIGWYVHHQGAGHLQRLVAVSRHLRTPVTAFGSTAPPEGFDGEWIRLDRDDDGPVDRASVTADGTLHWAPLHHPGLQDRHAAITAWIARNRPALFVTDVSVEVTALARLCGVPVVVFAMLGDRDDAAHRLGRSLASALLAPWPAARDRPDGGPPDGVSAPVRHVGAFSRFDGRRRPAEPSRPGTVLVLFGSGGRDVSNADFRAARAAAPGWTWEYRVPGSAEDAGGTEDVWTALHRAEVVVVHGGHNAVAEVAAARRPAVVIAQDRPFAEQLRRVELLRAEGMVALDRWPGAPEWPGLLDRARAAGAGPWERWAPGDGARRAAAFLDDAAGERR